MVHIGSVQYYTEATEDEMKVITEHEKANQNLIDFFKDLCYHSKARSRFHDQVPTIFCHVTIGMNHYLLRGGQFT
jgi:hypothetical protein